MEDKFEKRTKCLYCEKEMEAKYRSKKFCSDRCRVYYGRETARESPEIIEESMNEVFNEPPLSCAEMELTNENIQIYVPVIDISEILKQISDIESQKIPKERDTPLGRKVWNNEKAKRIAELKSKIIN